MRLNVSSFSEMAPFGPFAALIKGCSSYGRNGGQPQEDMANPQGIKVFAVERHGLPEDFVSLPALCGVRSSPLVLVYESTDCLGSATVVGTGRVSVLQVYGPLQW